MKNLQMPHSYISVSEEELRSISGGGPLGDALDLFFSNLRLDDLFFSGGLISLSFTFVPMLPHCGAILAHPKTFVNPLLTDFAVLAPDRWS